MADTERPITEEDVVETAGRGTFSDTGIGNIVDRLNNAEQASASDIAEALLDDPEGYTQSAGEDVED